MDIEHELAALITRVGALEKVVFQRPEQLATIEGARAQQIQADLYAAEAIGNPTSGMTEKYAVALRHPDLALLSTDQMAYRIGDVLAPPMMYGVKWEHVIAWYGGLIRADGGQGMFATPEQAASWPNKVLSDVGIGPG